MGCTRPASSAAAVEAAGATAVRSAPVVLVPSTGRTPAAVGSQQAFYSTNWSGYGKAGSYHAVSGTWTVPTATMHGGNDGFSSNWVGIGACGSPCGSDGTLIQAGTEQDVTGAGGKFYTAWYEILPNTEKQVAMTVRPGDTMNVSMEHPEEILFTWDSGFGNSALGVSEEILGADGTISKGAQIRYAPQKINRPQGTELLGRTTASPLAHMQDFVDAVRTGKPVNCPFDLGFRVSIACRMAAASSG